MNRPKDEASAPATHDEAKGSTPRASAGSWAFERGAWTPSTWRSRATRGLKQGIKRPLHALGYDIKQLSQPPWVYDPWQAQQRLLQHVDHPVIFDVGANVGQTLERYARMLAGAVIHSFEPFPSSYKRLAATAAAHPRAAAHQIALGETAGKATFHTNSQFHTRNSLLVRPRAGRRYYKEGGELPEEIIVTVETLDGFCDRHDIRKLNVLKLDVQGAELQVLRGGRELLKRMAVDMIFTEVMFVPHYEGGPLFCDIHSALGDYGYSLYGIYDMMVASNGQVRYGNALFLGSDVRVRVVDAFPPEK